jgi:hypothetical protein
MSDDYTKAGIWSTIETNLGIIAANAAPARTILNYICGGRSRESESGKYGSYGFSRKNRSYPSHNRSVLSGNRPVISKSMSFTVEHELPQQQQYGRRQSDNGSDKSEIPLRTLGDKSDYDLHMLETGSRDTPVEKENAAVHRF